MLQVTFVNLVQVALDRAAKLVGRLAYNRAVKEAVRDTQVSASCTHLRPASASALWSLLRCS